MMKHWEHTELVTEADFTLFSKSNHIITSSTSIPANTAVYVSYRDKRLEGIYDPGLKGIRPLKNKTAPNRDLRLYLDAIDSPHMTMVAIDGLMGTGKTSTCVEAVINRHLQGVKRAMGMKLQEHRAGDHKVLIAKPHVNAGGQTEQIGHLPGDIDEKMDPTLRNFIQYFDRFHQAGFEALREAKYVEILPLGFIRGLDAMNLTIIVDECQNTRELVSTATRKAAGSRIFFLGDTSPFQIDLAGNTPKDNGLTHLVDLLRGAPYFQYIEMKTLEHIVRSDEVRDIVRRLFKKYGQDPQEWAVSSK